MGEIVKLRPSGGADSWLGVIEKIAYFFCRSSCAFVRVLIRRHHFLGQREARCAQRDRGHPRVELYWPAAVVALQPTGLSRPAKGQVGGLDRCLFAGSDGGLTRARASLQSRLVGPDPEYGPERAHQDAAHGLESSEYDLVGRCAISSVLVSGSILELTTDAGLQNPSCASCHMARSSCTDRPTDP